MIRITIVTYKWTARTVTCWNNVQIHWFGLQANPTTKVHQCHMILRNSPNAWVMCILCRVSRLNTLGSKPRHIRPQQSNKWLRSLTHQSNMWLSFYAMVLYCVVFYELLCIRLSKQLYKGVIMNYVLLCIKVVPAISIRDVHMLTNVPHQTTINCISNYRRTFTSYNHHEVVWCFRKRDVIITEANVVINTIITWWISYENIILVLST